MKVKIICALSAGLILIGLVSFKNKTSESDPKIALLTYQIGKSNDDNFVITYGDGKIEKIPFEFKPASAESRIERQIKVAQISNQLLEKGFHFTGVVNGYDMFEKK